MSKKYSLSRSANKFMTGVSASAFLLSGALNSSSVEAWRFSDLFKKAWWASVLASILDYFLPNEAENLDPSVKKSEKMDIQSEENIINSKDKNGNNEEEKKEIVDKKSEEGTKSLEENIGNEQKNDTIHKKVDNNDKIINKEENEINDKENVVNLNVEKKEENVIDNIEGKDSDINIKNEYQKNEEGNIEKEDDIKNEVKNNNKKIKEEDIINNNRNSIRDDTNNNEKKKENDKEVMKVDAKQKEDAENNELFQLIDECLTFNEDEIDKSATSNVGDLASRMSQDVRGISYGVYDYWFQAIHGYSEVKEGLAEKLLTKKDFEKFKEQVEKGNKAYLRLAYTEDNSFGYAKDGVFFYIRFASGFRKNDRFNLDKEVPEVRLDGKKFKEGTSAEKICKIINLIALKDTNVKLRYDDKVDLKFYESVKYENVVLDNKVVEIAPKLFSEWDYFREKKKAQLVADEFGKALVESPKGSDLNNLYKEGKCYINDELALQLLSRDDFNEYKIFIGNNPELKPYIKFAKKMKNKKGDYNCKEGVYFHICFEKKDGNILKYNDEIRGNIFSEFKDNSPITLTTFNFAIDSNRESICKFINLTFLKNSDKKLEYKDGKYSMGKNKEENKKNNFINNVASEN